MGKVGKFELGKGVTFKLGMDLQKYLEDTISLKVRIPEGGAEVHHWIYEKAKRKHGLHPLVSITEAIEKDFDLVDADTQALLRIMGGANDSDEGSDDEVLMCNPRSDDPRTWKADDELEMFMEPVDTEDGGDDGRCEDGVVFIKMDQIVRPVYALVDDVRGGERTGWVAIEHLRPTFSTPRLTDSADKRRQYRAVRSTSCQGYRLLRRRNSGVGQLHARRANMSRGCVFSFIRACRARRRGWTGT